MWGIFRILNVANIYCMPNPVIYNGDTACLTSSIEEDRQKNNRLRPKQRSKAKKNLSLLSSIQNERIFE